MLCLYFVWISQGQLARYPVIILQYVYFKKCCGTGDSKAVPETAFMEHSRITFGFFSLLASFSFWHCEHIYILNCSLNSWFCLAHVSVFHQDKCKLKTAMCHFSVTHPATSKPAQQSTLKTLIHSPVLRSRYILPHLSNFHYFGGPDRSYQDSVWYLESASHRDVSSFEGLNIMRINC